MLPVLILYTSLQLIPMVTAPESVLHSQAAWLLGVVNYGGYWLLLGVASSIGLGTGLHTFVLYLGPFIAHLAMVSYDCGRVPSLMPSRWHFEYFEPCQAQSQATADPGFWNVVAQVELEAFLWGLGTAIGELPPYFVALAHAKAGEHD